MKGIRKVLLAVCSAICAGCLLTSCASNQVKVSYMVDGEVYREQSYDLNAEMALPKDPVKDGHVFVGWYTDEALTTPYAEGKITYGMTLYAKFNKSTLYITVNVNGGEKINPIAVTAGGQYTVPDAVKTGYTFTGYTYIDETGDEKEFPSSGVFNADASIRINANFVINKYTITLKDGFSDAPETAEVEYGKTYSPRPPVRAGYTFVDWYTSDQTQTDETKFDKTAPITDNVTLWAKYTANPYVVTLNLDGGTLDSASNQVNVTYASSYELPTPTKTGYTFAGYTLDGVDFANTGVYNYANNISVKANWTQNKYTVTFKNMDDSVNSTLTDILHGGKVNAPAAAAGYQLKAVYASDKQTAVDLATATVTAETTFYVEYEAKTFTITVNGAQDGYQNPSFKYGEAYTLVAPDRGEGYEFIGFKDQDNNDFPLTGTYKWTENITITAKWNSVNYNVYFYDGATEITSLRIEKQGGTDISTIAIPAAPVKTGYTADSVWYTDKEYTTAFVATGELTDDITLYAKYTANTYDVAITLNGGTYEGETATNDVVTVKATYGQTLTLKAPTKKGYKFDGYTLNGTAFTNGEKFGYAHGITLIANWTEDNKTVQFYVEGSLTDEVTVLCGDKVTAPTAPEKTGYTFKGWSTSQTAPTEDTLFDFDDAIETDTTLYAWFMVNTYTINVFERDKTTATEYTVEYGKVPTITEPTHDNYTFIGWFTEADGKGEEVDLLTYYKNAENITVYEYWTKKDDGSDPNFRDNGDNFQERADENAAWTYVYLVGHTYNFSGTTFTETTNEFAIVTNDENGKGKLVAVAPGTFTLTYTKGGQTGTMTIKVVEKVYTFNAGADYSNAWINRDASVWDNDTKGDVMNVGRTNFIPDVVITKNAKGEKLSLSEANVEITVKAGDTLVTDYTTDGTSITFGNTVADGTELTVTLAPRYAIFKGQKLTFTFTVNEGVNVYTSEQLRVAYEDPNVSNINVLRNINAELIAARTNTTGVGSKNNGNDSYTVTKEFTSPINPDGGAGVYDRVSGNLAINGNYFTVNGGNIPLVDNRDGDRGFNVCQNGNVLHNVQFALFKFGKDDSDISDKLTMENLNIIGNFNKATNTESDYTINDKKALIMSGSFIGLSVRSGNLYMDNVTARRCLFGVAIYGVNPKKTTNNETNSLHASSVYAKDCIFENSWANNVYTWGFGKVTLDSSFVGASSGAAIHFDSLASATPVNCALDMLNGTKVENWVLGTETWFDVYNVSVIVPDLKTLVQAAVAGYSGNTRTIIKNGTDNPTDQYVNFILLMKSPGDNSEWKTDDIGHGSVDVNMGVFDTSKVTATGLGEGAGSPLTSDYAKFAKDMTAFGFGYMEGIVGIVNAG